MTSADDVRRAAGFATRPPALTVQCPHCRAGPGQPCLTLGQPRRKPHPGRVDAGPDATVLAFPKEPRNA